jgi:hypothetical protein
MHTQRHGRAVGLVQALHTTAPRSFALVGNRLPWPRSGRSLQQDRVVDNLLVLQGVQATRAVATPQSVRTQVSLSAADGSQRDERRVGVDTPGAAIEVLVSDGSQLRWSWVWYHSF